MSIERPIPSKENSARAESVLSQTEGSLRQLIELHRLGESLIDEHDYWDVSASKPKLHHGGLESYTFEKYHRTGDRQSFWPRRSVRWVGDDNLCYLLQLYPNREFEKLIVWSRVGKAPFGSGESETFQDTITIELPMPPDDFNQLVENKFQLLAQEGAKIKTLITSSPNPHRADQL